VKLRIVPARTGIEWVKLGAKTFFRQPLALSGLFFMYVAAMLVLSQLPFIGPVVAGMLVPAATLGLMAASAEAGQGRFPLPTVLLSAFRAGRQRLRAMLVLGAIYTGGSLLATALGALMTAAPPEPAAAAAGADVAQQLDARTLVTLLLHMPLAILFWHAPALVHWHGISPVKSLFFSAVACLRNFAALFLYGLTWSGIFLGAGIVLSTLGLALGGAAIVRSLMVPFVLLLVAMFFTSIYFTFRDSFDAGDAPADEAPALPGPPP